MTFIKNSKAEIPSGNESDFSKYLIHTSPTFFISVNSEGNISFMSDELLQLLGYSLEEVLDKDFITTLIPEHESHKMVKLFNDLRGYKNQAFIENRMITKDGRELIVKCQWWQVLKPNNDLDFFYGVGSDITECIHAEKILKRNEVRYRVLEENVIDVIWTLNMDLRFTYISSSITSLLGYSVPEILGFPFEKILEPDSQKIFKKILSEWFFLKKQNKKEINKTHTVELELIHKDGYKIWTESKMKFIYDSGGKHVGILGVTRDITDRKTAEEEKEKIQAQLLHSQKMEAIGRLAGGIAHDFNNLLVVIMGYADLLSMKLPEESPFYDYASEIKSTAARAASLTRQLLSFSHKQILQMKLIDLNALVSEIEKMLRRLISEDIQLETILAPCNTIVKADPSQISQVIMNLVLNARDSMPNGGKVTIKTESITIQEEEITSIPEAQPGNYSCLSVQDTGTGIDQEAIKHIFEPFFTTKKFGEGTGLGLSVAYGIIKQHKGWIEVSSKKERGSTFKIYLPASAFVMDSENSEESSMNKGNGERILIVEDDPSVRKCLKKALQSNNYVIFDSANAHEGISVFKKEKGNIDLALIDIVLPDLNGFQLVDEIRLFNPDTRVLLTSGYMTQKSHWEIIKTRQIPFLQKPYDVENLLKKIRNVLNS